MITTRVSPHLLRYSGVTTLLERGMPIEQFQKFRSYSKLDTTQGYRDRSTERIRESVTTVQVPAAAPETPFTVC
jgi:site-specific recombinase XerD